VVIFSWQPAVTNVAMLYARAGRAASAKTPRMRQAARRLSRAPSQNHLTALTSRGRTIDTADADARGAPQNRHSPLWARPVTSIANGRRSAQLQGQSGRKAARLARAGGKFQGMNAFDPEVAAAVLAAELEEMGTPGDPAVRDSRVARIEAALRSAMRAGREACVALCLRRRALWERTESNLETSELLRAEARYRGNEAAYLADALAEPPSS
jgi:hypothetical protein